MSCRAGGVPIDDLLGPVAAVGLLFIVPGLWKPEMDVSSLVYRSLFYVTVPLHFDHKNRELVGLGSYLVNAVGDCNGCHSGPSGQFAPGGDPAQGQPKVINQAAYLQGGTPLFGPFFIPRNLTPDLTGRAEGGGSFAGFVTLRRTDGLGMAGCRALRRLQRLSRRPDSHDVAVA